MRLMILLQGQDETPDSTAPPLILLQGQDETPDSTAPPPP